MVVTFKVVNTYYSSIAHNIIFKIVLIYTCVVEDVWQSRQNEEQSLHML